MHRLGILLATSLALLSPWACRTGPDEERVLLVTTHSVEDSGLLPVLIDAFHADHPDLRVMVTAVGSGAALEIGRRGDADLLLTHDPVSERAFMAAGHGQEQATVMENVFVIVGPAADPAGLRGARTAAEAMQRIASSEARFLSRGDDSGTHQKERELWGVTGFSPWSDRPRWYVEAGLGMAETLQTGTQLDAYVLADEATYRQLAAGLRLVPLYASPDPLLRNPYSYTIPRRQHNAPGARVLADWLMGPGQEVIAAYGLDRFGAPLFRAAAESRPAGAEAQGGS